MRISLLYNDDAGDGVSLAAIRDALERYGHQLVRVIEKEEDCPRLLEEPSDLIVAAGGDGTASAAALALAGRDIPLAILPIGTANNVARSLGTHGSIEQLVGRWESARRQRFDLGVTDGGWGRRRFVESVGGGLIASGIAAMDARPGGEEEPAASELARAVREFRQALSRAKPQRWTFVADGTRTTGDFLLVEVLNTRFVGPNLVLAPDASSSDGLFSIVMAGEEHREELARYLEHRIEGRDCHPSLLSRRARRVEIESEADWHVDDEVLGPCDGVVSIRIEPGAVMCLA